MMTLDGTRLYHEAIKTIHDLRVENAALKEEVARLQAHVTDLNHDLQACVDDANSHGIEQLDD